MTLLPKEIRGSILHANLTLKSRFSSLLVRWQRRFYHPLNPLAEWYVPRSASNRFDRNLHVLRKRHRQGNCRLRPQFKSVVDFRELARDRRTIAFAARLAWRRRDRAGNQPEARTAACVITRSCSQCFLEHRSWVEGATSKHRRAGNWPLSGLAFLGTGIPATGLHC